MAGGRTSLYERQWSEVDALKSIYIVRQYNEIHLHKYVGRI